MSKECSTHFARLVTGYFQNLPSADRSVLERRFGLQDGVFRLPRDIVNRESATAEDARCAVDLALRRMRRHRSAVQRAIEHDFPHSSPKPSPELFEGLQSALNRSAVSCQHPDRWMTFLAYAFPDMPQLTRGRTFNQVVVVIFKLLRHLDERNRRVVTLRFGLEDGVTRSLEQIGVELGVTRERIRQLEAKALASIRSRYQRATIERIGAEWGFNSESSPLVVGQHIRAALVNEPEEFRFPDAWMRLLNKTFSHSAMFSDLAAEIAQAKRQMRDLMRANDGISVTRTEFVAERVRQGDSDMHAAALWEALAESEASICWRSEVAVSTTYRALAGFVLRQAGVPLHWEEMRRRAEQLNAKADFNPSTFYNAIGASSFFVYRGPGTYGLTEWGLGRKRFQKDVLVEWFRRFGGNAGAAEIVSGLMGTEDEIGVASVSLHLMDQPLFYEDLDGNYGLREWLPPPSEQRLDTPRSLREAKRSRQRRGSESNR